MNISHSRLSQRQLLAFCLMALGVVFGDIGTSPLYAMRECFHGRHAMAVTDANVLGVLSLIIWALLVVISLKYLVFILRADNRGEGGILALSVLVSHVKPTRLLAGLGLFGAALLYSDGMITPAISVLSAVEGLQVAAPALATFVQPITIAILILLFLMQRRGTAKVGTLFGPITLLWFLVIALLGILQIAAAPGVLRALSPHYAVEFFLRNGWHGFIVLGAVFLVVTGGEALYADIGHFGARPIRLVWFVLVLPALVANYLGQGALLLRKPHAAANLFFEMAPTWATYPLVLLASAAAVIASQALITGAFSLSMQSVQLGCSPRLTIKHTSAAAMGQIYLPLVNWILMLACVALVLGFGSSSNLAAAYGVSITTTMLITTLLFYVVARWKWHWNPWLAGLLCAFFVAVDLAFLGANFVKIAHGGWFPLVIAAIIFGLMRTWQMGRSLLSKKLSDGVLPLELLLEDIGRRPPVRVPGTAIFMSGNPKGTPPALLHNLKHNKVLHERILLLNVRMDEVPHVLPPHRARLTKLERGFWRAELHFGFMDEPNVPEALKELATPEFELVLSQTTFFLGREKVLCRAGKRFGYQEALFAWMSQNARDATSYFSLPPNRVVELGAQIAI